MAKCAHIQNFISPKCSHFFFCFSFLSVFFFFLGLLKENKIAATTATKTTRSFFIHAIIYFHIVFVVGFVALIIQGTKKKLWWFFFYPRGYLIFVFSFIHSFIHRHLYWITSAECGCIHMFSFVHILYNQPTLSWRQHEKFNLFIQMFVTHFLKGYQDINSTPKLTLMPLLFFTYLLNWSLQPFRQD